MSLTDRSGSFIIHSPIRTRCEPWVLLANLACNVERKVRMTQITVVLLDWSRRQVIGRIPWRGLYLLYRLTRRSPRLFLLLAPLIVDYMVGSSR